MATGHEAVLLRIRGLNLRDPPPIPRDGRDRWGLRQTRMASHCIMAEGGWFRCFALSQGFTPAEVHTMHCGGSQWPSSIHHAPSCKWPHGIHRMLLAPLETDCGPLEADCGPSQIAPLQVAASEARVLLNQGLTHWSMTQCDSGSWKPSRPWSVISISLYLNL